MARVAGAVATAAVALAVGGCGSGSGSGTRDPAVAAPRPVAAVPPGATRLTLGAPTRRAVPRGFLGLSIEFEAIRSYTGTDPLDIDPVFERLVRGLSPGQDPVLRIGGNSTDRAWTPGAGVSSAPSRASYELTPGWYATTAAFVRAVRARLTLGINVAGGRPAVARAQALAALDAFGRGAITALELGNEPNLYPTIAHYRPPTFDPGAYQRETQAIAAALPGALPPLRFVGPALSVGATTSDIRPWLAATPGLMHGPPALDALTIHRYPFKACFVAPAAPGYPTIAHLLSPAATAGLAASVRPWVAIARAAGRPLRVDELNSAACQGRSGVSDTFASALWAPDALFSLLGAGVAGVNVHTLPGAAYEPFALARDADGRWTARVRPLYYGLELFARAAPPGSRLLALDYRTYDRGLRVWATRAGDGSVRVLAIDTTPGRAATIALPAPRGAGGPVSVQRLTAPSVRSRLGVRLGGRTFGEATGDGTLEAPRLSAPGRAPDGDYVVRVPGASAALITFGAS